MTMLRRVDDYAVPYDELEDRNIERIAKDVAAAETKDEIIFLLAQVCRQFEHEGAIIDCDVLIKDSAEGLVASLHNAILLRDGSMHKYYRTSLTYNRALQCTVLITTIEMMLRFSPESLLVGDKINLIRDDLVPSIPKLLKLFIAWEGSSTIRLLAISNIVRIMRRVGPMCDEATHAFVEGLLIVLRSHLGTKTEENGIHVEAAHAIAYLFDQQSRVASRKRVIEQIQDDSSQIISTLSTAALASSNYEDDEEILTGLFNFAVNSHTFRSKMAKRRCTILAIGRHLNSDNVETRKLALNICKCLLNDHVDPETEPPRMETSSAELLVNKVIDSAYNETEPMLQLYAISLLGDAVRNANLPSTIVDNIMNTLDSMVDSDGQDEVVIEASVTYSTAASSLHPAEVSPQMLRHVADFTTLPFARARAGALVCIDYFATSEELAAVLLNETDAIENFSLIMTFGSDEDCADVMNIVRLLARNPAHHQALCQSYAFLNSLVQLVTQEEVTSRDAYVGGVETCLALLANNDNVNSFLPFPDLLPFLVSLANTTVSDEELKQKLVSSIVRLSSAILG